MNNYMIEMYRAPLELGSMCPAELRAERAALYPGQRCSRGILTLHSASKSPSSGSSWYSVLKKSRERYMLSSSCLTGMMSKPYVSESSLVETNLVYYRVCMFGRLYLEVTVAHEHAHLFCSVGKLFIGMGNHRADHGCIVHIDCSSIIAAL